MGYFEHAQNNSLLSYLSHILRPYEIFFTLRTVFRNTGLTETWNAVYFVSKSDLNQKCNFHIED
jgi:hypothetical protein